MLRHPEIMDFHIEDPRWRHVPHICAHLEKAAVATLSHLPKGRQFPCKITLLLTKDAVVRRLNHDFRGIDKPTNVLSFPQFDPKDLPKINHEPEPIHIGDIAIAYKYVEDEVKREGKEFTNHVVHLTIHGILHLFGYDHQISREALKMERLEQKVMAELGLPDPYAIPKPKARAMSLTTKKVRSE